MMMGGSALYKVVYKTTERREIMNPEKELVELLVTSFVILIFAAVLVVGGFKVEHPYNIGNAPRSPFHSVAITSEIVGCILGFIAICGGLGAIISNFNTFVQLLRHHSGG